MSNAPYSASVLRAALPEILFAPDLVVALDVPEGELLAAMCAGHLGPCFLVRGRPAILRTDLIDRLGELAAAGPSAAREVLP